MVDNVLRWARTAARHRSPLEEPPRWHLSFDGLTALCGASAKGEWRSLTSMMGLPDKRCRACRTSIVAQLGLSAPEVDV